MSKEFKRQDYMRLGRLGKNKRTVSWRKPKGRDSKMRLSMAGYPKTVSRGYASPRATAGKIRNLNPILVHNKKELQEINAKTQIAILARIGAKKKLELIKLADEKNIQILNVKKGDKK